MNIIELTDNELKLLKSILSESIEYRSSMGCNDPYSHEEKIFTENERMQICKYLKIEDDEYGFLFNMQYVEYIIKRIKEQIK